MSKKGKISASMMCAGLDKLFYYLTEFKEANLEFLHLDIMDGRFVPNITLGTDYTKSLRRITDIPFDYHFMTYNTLEKLNWFDIRECDIVTIHYENNDKVQECLDYISQKGAQKFIAISPDTDFNVLLPYMDQIDGVLVMTVYPGFAGQKLVPFTVEKVKKLREYLNSVNLDIEIEVDGNITIENAKLLYDNGATIFVAGTSSLFGKVEKSVKCIIDEKRKVIGW